MRRVCSFTDHLIIVVVVQFSLPLCLHPSLHTDSLFQSISTTIGLRCKDGVVFGVEKLVTSKLHEEGSNKRIFTVDRHIGMV